MNIHPDRLAANLADIERRIDEACRRVGRVGRPRILVASEISDGQRHVIATWGRNPPGRREQGR